MSHQSEASIILESGDPEAVSQALPAKSQDQAFRRCVTVFTSLDFHLV